MAKIDFQVSVTGGAGIGVFISVGSNNLRFPTSGTQPLDLAPGDYTATVSGAEPSSASVDIKILEGATVLQESSFSDTTFWGFMPFTVV
jgi:hypothetical protein